EPTDCNITPSFLKLIDWLPGSLKYRTNPAAVTATKAIRDVALATPLPGSINAKANPATATANKAISEAALAALLPDSINVRAIPTTAIAGKIIRRVTSGTLRLRSGAVSQIAGVSLECWR